MPKGGKISPATEFKKGQTGNPKGRPKKLPNLDALLANVLGEENKDGMSAAEAILIKLRAEAAKGNIRAAELILSHAYGKPKQRIDLTTEAPLNITINEVVYDASRTARPGSDGGTDKETA